MTRLTSQVISESAAFWVTIAFVVMVFALGGGSRADIEFLKVLRPASVLFLIYGLWGLRSDQVAPFRVLFGFAAVLLIFVAVELIPLPPSIWRALPGREVAAQIDHMAGLGDVWRPVSLVPVSTWNALFALIVPVTMLVLLARLRRQQLYHVLLVILVFGVLSGLIGLLQVIGPSDGPLYFYQITNFGSSVGLFANRNHQAALLACMFPMLAAYASYGVTEPEDVRRRGWTALLVGILIVPLLLMTGSRAGLVLGLIGLIAVPLVYKRPVLKAVRKRKQTLGYMPYVLGGATVVGLGLLTFLLARASVFSRIFAQDPTDDLRWQIWGPIFRLSGKYFPFGSGVGSFVEVFEMDEPRHILDTTYVNHAHNDFLEVLMTGGAPAVLLFVAAVVFWVMATRRALFSRDARPTDTVFARLGSVLVFMLAVASVSDYPLRVPSMACLFVLAAVWLAPFSLRLPSKSNTELRQIGDGSIATPSLRN